MANKPGAGDAPRIVLFSDDPGWHGAQLTRALGVRGATVATVSLGACHLELAGQGAPVRVPGFGEQLPDGVFVRGVPGGSLEEVTLCLGVLHALAELGITVYNDARAIERTVDKGMTSFLLRRASLPTPPTWVTRDADEARAIVRRELASGQQMVSKPLFGSQGEGLQRLQDCGDLADLASSHGVYYLQRFAAPRDPPFHDWRVFVIAGRAVAAMRRHGRTWLNNVAQGARCESARLDEPLCRLAEEATRAIGMHYAGVDILAQADGTLTIIEVNSVPAWKGLQSVTETRIADHLAADFLARALPQTGQDQAA